MIISTLKISMPYIHVHILVHMVCLKLVIRELCSIQSWEPRMMDALPPHSYSTGSTHFFLVTMAGEANDQNASACTWHKSFPLKPYQHMAGSHWEGRLSVYAGWSESVTLARPRHWTAELVYEITWVSFQCSWSEVRVKGLKWRSRSNIMTLDQSLYLPDTQFAPL